MVAIIGSSSRAVKALHKNIPINEYYTQSDLYHGAVRVGNNLRQRLRYEKETEVFCQKFDTKIDDFDTVLETIKAFLAEPFLRAIDST